MGSTLSLKFIIDAYTKLYVRPYLHLHTYILYSKHVQIDRQIDKEIDRYLKRKKEK